jgi:hypothetical protein
VSIENSHGINTVRAICNVISNINNIYRLQFVHLRWFWNCGNYKHTVNVLYFQSKIICCWRRKSYVTHHWYDTFLDWLKESGKLDEAITWHCNWSASFLRTEEKYIKYEALTWRYFLSLRLRWPAFPTKQQKLLSSSIQRVWYMTRVSLKYNMCKSEI